MDRNGGRREKILTGTRIVWVEFGRNTGILEVEA